MHTRSTPPIRTPIARLLLDSLARAGVDTAAVAADLGLPDDARSQPFVVISVDTLVGVWDRAAALLDDPNLGLHTAESLDRGVYGLFEFGIRAAQQIREGLAKLIEYISLFNRVAHIELREQGGLAHLEQTAPGRPHGLGRHANEFFVALVLRVARELSGTSFIPKSVWFSHPAPADVAEHARILQTSNLEFDRISCGFSIPAAALDVPLLTADPALARAVDAHANAALRRGSTPFTASVAAALRSQLGSSDLSVAAVARQVGLSPRSVQRFLHRDGTSFQKLADEVRCNVARELLDEGTPVDAVAERLGYRDLVAFNRAFRRWTSETPAQYLRDREEA